MDSTKARKAAWKLLWLGVLPKYRQKGVFKLLVDVVALEMFLVFFSALDVNSLENDARERVHPLEDQTSEVVAF